MKAAPASGPILRSVTMSGFHKTRMNKTDTPVEFEVVGDIVAPKVGSNYFHVIPNVDGRKKLKWLKFVRDALNAHIKSGNKL